jgi:predicted nucleic acid-binding Zn ribbon protein
VPDGPAQRVRGRAEGTGRASVPDEPAPSEAAPSEASASVASSQEAEPSGAELARAVLAAAKGRRTQQPRREPSRGGRRPRGYSGPGPDPRDPQPFGAVLAKLLQLRGWQQPAARARLFELWPSVVGADVAQHCRPVKLEEGQLTIEAESTAWATQIRLLSRTLLGRISADLGADLVTTIAVHGPVSPSWVKGPKRVRGRGPRDTYG